MADLNQNNTAPAESTFQDSFTAAVLDLAGNIPLHENKKGKKTLISVRNLKQYFPVKGHKNMFVKANDGINIDIYEGETFGLVGESGCGKSTLGRTLLQLYQQTEGHTLFYGRTLDYTAPKYLYNSIRELSGKKQKLMKLYTMKSKAAMDMFLDLVYIFGGLLLSPNESEVIAAYTERYKNISGTTEIQVKQKSQKFEALRRNIADNSIIDINNFFKLEPLRDDGINLSRLNYDEMRHLRRDMQIIFQDPYSSLNPRMTVGQIISEGLLAHGSLQAEGKTREQAAPSRSARMRSALQEQVMKVMINCGLAPYMIHRYPHQFSGGQRQRIGIARSLAVKPKFVVCDEAVSALDASIQSQILNLLSELKEKEKLTYLFISHDLSVVKYVSDRIGVMYLGNIVEIARSQEIFKNPLHPYTEALLSAIPTTNVDKPKNSIVLEGDIPSPINPPKGCKFHTRCRYVTDVCRETEPQFTENEPEHFVACHRH